jgi:hypothetical protein
MSTIVDDDDEDDGDDGDDVEVKLPFLQTSDVLISIASHELSSVRWPLDGKTYPFNIADLNWPYPYSAWRPVCSPQWSCRTITKNSFYPYVALGTHLQNLHPEWKTCTNYPYGMLPSFAAVIVIFTF